MKKNINDVDSSIDFEDDVNEVQTEPDYKDLYLRSLADYDNMKKRYTKMIQDSERQGLGDAIKKIVSPLYNDIKRGVDNGVNGCEIILNNLIKMLYDNNISIIDDYYEGKDFDTDFMQAISLFHTDDESYSNKVKNVFEHGFVDDETKQTLVFAKVTVYSHGK